MSRLRVSSVWKETTVSPPCDSSRAFGGRKRATTFIAELRTISIAGVGGEVYLMMMRSLNQSGLRLECVWVGNAVGSYSRSHVQQLSDTQPETKNRFHGLRTRINLVGE